MTSFVQNDRQREERASVDESDEIQGTGCTKEGCDDDYTSDEVSGLRPHMTEVRTMVLRLN